MEALMNTKQAAAYLNTPAQTLVTWRCTGRVKPPYVKLGGNVRYRKVDLDVFISAHTRGVDDSES